MSDHKFPADFIWGAATSAYQIEGSPLADGASESIWHRFAHTPGKVFENQHADLACDHYRRYRDDIALLRELGIPAYRFSISWSRVLPEGTGCVNAAGLDFYKRLVDELAANDIRPMATLYHWDLPQSIEDRGGWANPESAKWFAEYADVLIRALDDRVPLWATLNEPWVVVHEGYVMGGHAPGRRDWREAVAVSKNLLKAHAAAVEVYRARGRNKIGLVVNLVPIHPASESDSDRQAANRWDAYFNRQFLDPALLGKQPSEMADLYGPAWTDWTAEELAQVSAPIDFVGINYYLRLVATEDPAGGPARTRSVRQPQSEYTAMDWEVYPQGLTEILEWVAARYGNVPLYITENGIALDDVVAPNGRVDDVRRVQYLDSHLRAAREAIGTGVDLRGYFVWSLLDNFEWQAGFSKRFGIVRVDFETQERVPKASARFYSDVVRTNGGALGG
ncbi:MAG TPA: GH1 family beta-glucosidase [Lacipirellulaceae bacterium]|nr:GH1 family beta-glucosidase [Lacipirellulaceae bacterium]